MSDEVKQAEEKAEEQIEIRNEEKGAEENATVTEEQIEETSGAGGCCEHAKSINFWKLATVFLLLAWGIQNWRLSQAEEKAAKIPPYIKGDICCPENEDNPAMQENAMNQMYDLKEYATSNQRGAAPMLINNPENVYFRTFIPSLENYKVNVSVNNGALNIAGIGSAGKDEIKQGSVMLENSVSKFDYSVKLPCAVKDNEIKIDKGKNILTVIMPKVTPDKVPSCCAKDAEKLAVPVDKKTDAAKK